MKPRGGLRAFAVSGCIVGCLVICVAFFLVISGIMSTRRHLGKQTVAEKPFPPSSGVDVRLTGRDREFNYSPRLRRFSLRLGQKTYISSSGKPGKPRDHPDGTLWIDHAARTYLTFHKSELQKPTDHAKRLMVGKESEYGIPHFQILAAQMTQSNSYSEQTTTLPDWHGQTIVELSYSELHGDWFKSRSTYYRYYLPALGVTLVADDHPGCEIRQEDLEEKYGWSGLSTAPLSEAHFLPPTGYTENTTMKDLAETPATPFEKKPPQGYRLVHARPEEIDLHGESIARIEERWDQDRAGYDGQRWTCGLHVYHLKNQNQLQALLESSEVKAHRFLTFDTPPVAGDGTATGEDYTFLLRKGPGVVLIDLQVYQGLPYKDRRTGKIEDRGEFVRLNGLTPEARAEIARLYRLLAEGL